MTHPTRPSVAHKIKATPEYCVISRQSPSRGVTSRAKAPTSHPRAMALSTERALSIRERCAMRIFYFWVSANCAGSATVSPWGEGVFDCGFRKSIHGDHPENNHFCCACNLPHAHSIVTSTWVDPRFAASWNHAVPSSSAARASMRLPRWRVIRGGKSGAGAAGPGVHLIPSAVRSTVKTRLGMEAV